jgi:hypothetical protein
MIRSTIIALAITLSIAAPALAQGTTVLPATNVTVVSTGITNGLPFAVVRDNTMRGHNVYCVTVGAHIGSATVARITSDGIELTDGRALHALTATLATASSTAQGNR